MRPARLDLLSFVGRAITEVIVGKPHLQLVAGVALRQVAKVIAGECLILGVDVLFSRFSWRCRATLHVLAAIFRATSRLHRCFPRATRSSPAGGLTACIRVSPFSEASFEIYG